MKFNLSLSHILWIALAVRIVAVLFAKGYIQHDDHFLTVEPSASWAAGQNFNDWIPGYGNDNEHPEPISFFYLGFLYSFFSAMESLGLDHPDYQMMIIRLLHALWSLLTIRYAWKLTELLSGKEDARRVGLLLALIAVYPNFSVRNLVEMVCQPLLVFGFYWLVKHGVFRSFRLGTAVFQGELKSSVFSWKALLWAACVMGLAVGVRYQTGLLVAMIGAVLLIQRSFWPAVVFGVTSLAAFSITQIDDVLLWGGEPFQHLRGYFEYNKSNAQNYPGAPLTYLSFIGYFILPPVSLFLVFGYFRNWKKYFFLFLPVLAFLVFHIIYPNRQERFILPALPFVVMLGVIGWQHYRSQSAYWQQNESLHTNLWRFFWVINTIVLLVFSTTYAKRSRVEAMLYLYEQKDYRNFFQDYSYTEGGALVPQYYAGKWNRYYILRKSTDMKHIFDVLELNAEKRAQEVEPQPVPNYALFFNDTDLPARVEKLRVRFPDMHEVAVIEAGWFDRFLHWVNPVNTAETVYVWKLE